MKIASRILLISLFLLIVATAPWLLIASDSGSLSLSRIVLGAEVVALIVLILDLAVFKNIDRIFGQTVNAQTVETPFSTRRIAYLLFVYLTPVSAVLGLLASAR